MDHIGELSSIEETLLIAMTADNFFFSINDQDDEETFSRPWVGMDKTVFSRPSHLVILSQAEIPGATKLPWTGKGIAVDDVKQDFHVFIANTVWRGAIRVAHNKDMIFGVRNGVRVSVKGELPPLPHNVEESQALIGRFFDRYAMYYAVGRTLTSDIKLSGFSSPDNSGGTIERTGKLMARLAKNYPKENVRELVRMIPSDDRNRWKHLKNKQQDAYQEKRDITERIGRAKQLRQRRTDLSNQFTAAQQAKDFARLNEIKREQAELKERIQALGDPYDELNSVNGRIEQVKRDMDDIIAHVKTLGIPMTDKDIEACLSIDEAGTLGTIPRIQFQDGVYTAATKTADCASTIETMQKSGLVCDRIPLMDITISHRKKSCRFEKPDEFTEAVKRICARFGGVVCSVGRYTENRGGKDILGSIHVSLYTYEFLLPFVSELTVQMSISGGQEALRIPFDLCPVSLLSRKEVHKAFTDWAKEHGISLQWASRTRVVCPSRDLAQARKLLADPDTRPVFPFKIHRIPGGMNLDAIQSVLRGHNRKLGSKPWVLVRLTKSLVTPVDVSDEAVKAFLEKASRKAGAPSSGEDLLFDYFAYCEENAEHSGCQIPVYYEDGSVRLYTFCVFCCHSLLSYNVGTFFNAETDEPIMERLCEAVDPIPTITALGEPSEGAWPAVPIGQFLWMLASEPKTKAVAKTWFSAKVFQALRASQMFESCPVHASMMVPVPAGRERINCPQKGCGYYRCPDCLQWHEGGCNNAEFVLPPGLRRCPNCKRPCVKISGCNRISCSCGKHFCYYCEFGPADTATDVYNHLSSEHGGYWKDPPDFKRYILGESVSDEQLNAFYEKYPWFRPS